MSNTFIHYFFVFLLLSSKRALAQQTVWFDFEANPQQPFQACEWQPFDVRLNTHHPEVPFTWIVNGNAEAPTFSRQPAHKTPKPQRAEALARV